MNIWNAIMELGCELEAAERKFPGWPTDPVHAAAVLQEEAGELVRASLQFTYKNGDLSAMRREAVQTGAMALRFLLNLTVMKSRPSDQVERVSNRPKGRKHWKPEERGFVINKACHAATVN